MLYTLPISKAFGTIFAIRLYFGLAYECREREGGSVWLLFVHYGCCCCVLCVDVIVVMFVLFVVWFWLFCILAHFIFFHWKKRHKHIERKKVQNNLWTRACMIRKWCVQTTASINIYIWMRNSHQIGLSQNERKNIDEQKPTTNWAWLAPHWCVITMQWTWKDNRVDTHTNEQAKCSSGFDLADLRFLVYPIKKKCLIRQFPIQSDLEYNIFHLELRKLLFMYGMKQLKCAITIYQQL